MARRWLVHVVIVGFLGVQVAIAVRAAFFGGNLPWRMFASRSNADTYLMAMAIGPEGESTVIPMEQIFRYARGATDRRIPDNFKPITEGTDPERRAGFARFLGGWAR